MQAKPADNRRQDQRACGVGTRFCSCWCGRLHRGYRNDSRGRGARAVINRPITTSLPSGCPCEADRSIWLGSDERE